MVDFFTYELRRIIGILVRHGDLNINDCPDQCEDIVEQLCSPWGRFFT